VYAGPFGKAQAERLLWRAGFGARPGEAEALAALGLEPAIESLTRPKRHALVGPKPTDEHGRPLDPIGQYGHDHLWWLDRMVRTTAPAIERMTLVWHSWFATSNVGVGSHQLMLNQNQLFREHALGSFADLLNEVTIDPAMLLWLNGNQNVKGAPNENYGREMMELFTLGADRGAYTEDDVRENARALTGWKGPPFFFDESLHDEGTKTIFARSGDFSWQDSCRLCLTHPLHPSYLVTKLWGYFVPAPPDATTLSALTSLYADGYRIRPVVEAILRHPLLYSGPRMVKSPVVLTAGLLRTRGRGIDTSIWWSLDHDAGQMLFYPPDVGGWDYTRWLDTATYHVRWFISALVQGAGRPTDSPNDPAALVESALAFWAQPTLTPQTRRLLTEFAQKQLARDHDPAVVETAVRRLVASSPDLQTA
jgi:uncharacterized protein (DUF1800 family)